MRKRFNYKGVCIPEKHYMVDISEKTAQIFQMIQQGDYFVINRPRQYGKTTTIYMLNRFLKTRKGYLLIYDLRKERNKSGALERTAIDNKEIVTAWI